MTKLDALFPDRPLKVTRSGKGPFWPLIGLILALGLSAGLIWWQGPELWRDYRMSRDYSVVPDGQVTGGSCTTKAFVFTNCNVKIAYPIGGARRLKTIEFMFLTFNAGGDYIVDVVRANDAPGQITISLALEKIWNRVVMAALFLGILLAGVWAGLRGFLLGRATKKALSQPVRLRPYVAAITQSQSLGFGSSVEFSYAPDAETAHKSSGFFKRSEKPLIFGDGLSLAVLPEGGQQPILLDAGLKRVELTEAERAAIFQGLGVAPA